RRHSRRRRRAPRHAGDTGEAVARMPKGAASVSFSAPRAALLPSPRVAGRRKKRRRREADEGLSPIVQFVAIAPHPALASLGPPSPRFAGRGKARRRLA